MQIERFKMRFRTARGREFRRIVVDRAAELPGAPEDLSEDSLIHIERRCGQPPRGDHVRYFAAALGLDLLQVLEDLGYWPPVSDIRPEDLIRDLCRRTGARLESNKGKRVTLVLP